MGLGYFYTGKKKAVVACVNRAVWYTGTEETGKTVNPRRGSVPFGLMLQDQGQERQRRSTRDGDRGGREIAGYQEVRSLGDENRWFEKLPGNRLRRLC